jgi:uncharacterized repeat protein (TIGR01451 family)
MHTNNLSLKLRSHRPLLRGIAAVCLSAAVVAVTASCGPPPPECACDAALIKLVSEPPVAGGDGLFVLFVQYHGDETCDGGELCVDDELPQGLTCDPNDPAYSGGSPNTDWTCTCDGGSAVRCCFNSALPSEPATLPMIQVPVLVAPDAPKNEKNCASIAQDFPGSFEDHIVDNNMSCAEYSPVQPRIDVGIDKHHEGSFRYQEAGSFELTVTNLGDASVTGFTVVDAMPPGFHFIATSAPNWDCTAVSNLDMSETVTCTYSSALLPAAFTTLNLQVTLGDAEDFTGKDEVNCAEVTLAGDVNAENDSDCDPYCISGKVVHYASGVNDIFHAGDKEEPPSPSHYLLDWIAQNYAYSGVRNYDDNSGDRYFGHTFSDLQLPEHDICGAALKLRVRCGDTNDAVALYFTNEFGVDLSARWFYPLVDFDSPCDGSVHTLIELDLEHLQPYSTASTDLLPALASYEFLDVLVQDDTMVDFVDLDVTYCCE